jgi:hypothetical protein
VARKRFVVSAKIAMSCEPVVIPPTTDPDVGMRPAGHPVGVVATTYRLTRGDPY